MVRLFIMVLVGAFIGWITNFIAIRLLFRPRYEKKLWLFKFQGVIPKRKKALAESISKVVSEKLLSVKDITEKLHSIEIDNELEEIVNKIVNDKFKEEVFSKFQVPSFFVGFINDSVIPKFKDYIKKIIFENKDELIMVVAKKIESSVDFKTIVSNKIEGFSLDQLEQIILSIAKRELREIENIGAVLGGIIGLVQFLIVNYLK